MGGHLKDRRLRLAVSAAVLVSLNLNPVMAQSQGRAAVLNACSTQREGLL